MTFFVVVLAVSNIHGIGGLGEEEKSRVARETGYAINTESMADEQIKRVQRYVEALVKELSGLEAKQATLERQQSNTTDKLDFIASQIATISHQLSNINNQGEGSTKSQAKDLKRYCFYEIFQMIKFIHIL